MTEPTPASTPAPAVDPAADTGHPDTGQPDTGQPDELDPVRAELDRLHSMPTAGHLDVYTHIADGLAARLDAPEDAAAGHPNRPDTSAEDDAPADTGDPGRPANG